LHVRVCVSTKFMLMKLSKFIKKYECVNSIDWLIDYVTRQQQFRWMSLTKFLFTFFEKLKIKI